MKKNHAIILFVFIVFITAMLSGCKSSGVVVKHDIKYTHKGSKSQGNSGYLIINGKILPDCFSKVAADGKVYVFTAKNTLWGNDGYFPSEHESVDTVFPAVNKKLSDTELQQGWSEVTGRYLNIPANWIFVKWENGSAVSDPEKIDELVQAKSIKIIPRYSSSGRKLFKL